MEPQLPVTTWTVLEWELAFTLSVHPDSWSSGYASPSKAKGADSDSARAHRGVRPAVRSYRHP